MTLANFPSLKVEVAFGGPSIVWSDVTAYVRSLTFSYGRTRENDHYQPGTGVLRLINDDARFSPANTTGPYASAGVSGVRPLRPIRIQATWNAVTYGVAYGYLGDPAEQWINGESSVATFPFTDGLSLLANFKGATQGSQGGSELTGARMSRILTNAGWPGASSIGLGSTTCQPTDLSTNALTELYLTADSEGGAMWVDPIVTAGASTFVFESRTALVEQTRSTVSNGTFGDGAGELPYAESPQPIYSRELLANSVAIGRVGGVVQSSTDATSIGLFGGMGRNGGRSRTDLITENDSQSAVLAQFAVAAYANPEYRFRSITINPLSAPSTLWPQVLGRRIRDRIVVKRRPFTSRGSAMTITNNAFIDGISVSYEPGVWRTTWQLASTTAYDGFSFAVWDTGLWDTATWFY